MTDNRTVWDTAYRRRSRLYGGTAQNVGDLRPRARVLELGCGSGKNAVPLLARGYDVIALDFSRSALLAVHSVFSSSENGHVLLADARAIPVSSGSCDAVIARHVIGHLPKDGRAAASREICRVLCNGGVLYFSAFSKEDFRFGSGERTEEGTFLRGTGITTHYFSENEVSSLFSPLTCRSLHTETWPLHVRGKEYCRSEVHGLFVYEDPEV
jgi:SAM-dependent methyltransferase